MAFSYDLLPPIVPDTVPPIINKDFIRIPLTLYKGQGFQQSLANFGIQTVQVSLINQNNDPSSRSIFYIEGVQVKRDKQKQNIFNLDLKINTSFSNKTIKTLLEENIYYKVQLRFSTQSISKLKESADPANFSQWSSVCLIKKIAPVELYVQLGGITLSQSSPSVISSALSNLKGELSSKSGETLKNYQVLIYKYTNDNQQNNYNLFFKSDILTPDYRNNFSYSFPQTLQKNQNYLLIIKYSTISGYSNYKNFNLYIKDDIKEEQPFYIQAEADEQAGEIKIHIFAQQDTERNFIIQRASSDDNYQIWEDVGIIQFKGSELPEYQVYPDDESQKIKLKKYTWADKTIESGMFYKYQVAILYKQQTDIKRGIKKQILDNSNIYLIGSFTTTKNAYTCIFDDMYLIGNGKSLRIRYNPIVNNFKYNVNESVQTTLGSKYPFISRTGKTNYRSFFIGGLITSFMDTDTRGIVPSFYDLPKTNNQEEIKSVTTVYLQQDKYKIIKSIFTDFVPGPVNTVSIGRTITDIVNNPAISTITLINNEKTQSYIPKEGDVVDYGQPSFQYIYHNAQWVRLNSMNIELKNFTSVDELFSKSTLVERRIHNTRNNINQYTDIIYERKFRQAVYNFLYDNNPKLFKSSQEGNVLIKLTNLNFTPMEQLGRQLYSFSAEAIEIDQCSIPNYYKYNIYNKGQWQELRKVKTIAIEKDIDLGYKNINVLEEIQKDLDEEKIVVNFSNFLIKVLFKRNEKISTPLVNLQTKEYISSNQESIFTAKGWLVKITTFDGFIEKTQKVFINQGNKLSLPAGVELKNFTIIGVPSTYAIGKNRPYFRIRCNVGTLDNKNVKTVTLSKNFTTKLTQSPTNKDIINMLQIDKELSGEFL